MESRLDNIQSNFLFTAHFGVTAFDLPLFSGLSFHYYLKL